MHFISTQLRIALVSLCQLEKQSFANVRNRDKLADNKCLFKVTLSLKLPDIANTLVCEYIVRDAHKPVMIVHIIGLTLLHLVKKDAQDSLSEPPQTIILGLLIRDIFAKHFGQRLVRIWQTSIDSQ